MTSTSRLSASSALSAPNVVTPSVCGMISTEKVSSLTVNDVTDDTFSVLIIPHTLGVTTFGALKAGDALNIEVDVMARYAARLMETR